MKLFIGKFVKAFLTGGVVAVSASIAAGVSFKSLEEAKHLFVVLLLAFLSGGFHAGYAALFPPK